jgi:hypothetical protein
MPFSPKVSSNLADDPDLLKMMTQAGFDTIFVGFESSIEGSLAECSKNQNKDRDLVESIKQLHHVGLQLQRGFLVGFENDSASTCQPKIQNTSMKRYLKNDAKVGRFRASLPPPF